MTADDRQPARPLRRDAERNRERIIEAARAVFAERGMTATLDDVARRAEVGVGTVYRRFGSKETLAEAAFEGRLEQVAALAEEALAAPTGWDGLVAFLEGSTALHAGDRGLRDILLGADFGGRYFTRAGAEIVPRITRLVDRAQREGALRSDVTAQDLPIIMMTISELAHRSSGLRPAIYRRYLRLIIDGLRAGHGTGDLGPAPTADLVTEVARRWMPVVDDRQPAGRPSRSRPRPAP